MFFRYFLYSIIFLCATGLISDVASAESREPGSVLLFPVLDTTGKVVNIVTITNVDNNPVSVRLVFVDGDGCEPMDLFLTLTGQDTFTFASNYLFPQKGSGYLYVYVIDKPFSEIEGDADVLIGQELVLGSFNGQPVDFTINAATFQVLNLKPDGVLQLDGSEYTLAPETCYFPRFFAQQPDTWFHSSLILMNLSGALSYSLQTKVLIYNDNEVVFSKALSTDCHDSGTLLNMLGPVVSQTYLLSTNHDLLEPFGFATLIETGHMNLTGAVTVNPTGSIFIDDPSIYAVLIENITSYLVSGADLPFQTVDPDVFVHGVLSTKYD